MSVVSQKAFLLRRRILCLLSEGNSTIADLSQRLGVSNPTINKLVLELSKRGFVRETGKIETPGGRRPLTYGLIPEAGYFLGVNLSDDQISVGAIDLNRSMLERIHETPFQPANNTRLIETLSEQIDRAIEALKIPRDKIFGLGLSLKGRIDPSSGVVYDAANPDGFALAQALFDATGIETVIENDTRAMTYAEFFGGLQHKAIHNALFINMGRGIGVGVVVGGKLYYGKSGFSGEFGHIPFFENDRVCYCGKRGCLETEVSGAALEEQIKQRLAQGVPSVFTGRFAADQPIPLHEVVAAVRNDDVLTIELVTHMGEKLGRGIGVLINLFNPELVVVSGALAEMGDYLMLPIRTALNKYSLRLVTQDTSLRLSRMDERGAILGAALLTRNRMLGIV